MRDATIGGERTAVKTGGTGVERATFSFRAKAWWVLSCYG
jgi:hypothetical protein